MMLLITEKPRSKHDFFSKLEMVGMNQEWHGNEPGMNLDKAGTHQDPGNEKEWTRTFDIQEACGGV